MKVDMSARAVTTRLQRASQLRRLCVSLGRALESTRSPTGDAVPHTAPVTVPAPAGERRSAPRRDSTR